MFALAILIALIPCSLRLSAQGLSTNRVESVANAPLVIAQRAPAGMPIRVLAGAGGSVRSLEIDATGGTWIKGPVSIGALTGAQPNELIRISSVADADGRGLVISLSGTSTSSGLVISDVGLSGSDNAAMVISSAANGTGTGLRLGGPSGSSRPSLATGIDITGGVGLRYNALTSGSGTGIDVGGSQPPRRGIEVVAAGSDHVGVIAHANTLGTGMIGSSRSLAFPTVGSYLRVGVVGHGATNSAVRSDTCTGVLGVAIRGGTGGSSTITLGAHGIADMRTGTSTGIGIGVLGRTQQTDQFGGLVIGGMFRAASQGFALVADGDVYLGSTEDDLPATLNRAALGLERTTSTTYVHNLIVSGGLSMRALHVVPPHEEIQLSQAGTVVQCSERAARRVRGAAGSRMSGITPVENGKVVVLCNVGDDDLILVHNDLSAPEHERLDLSREVDATFVVASCVWFWYDGTSQRWRRIQ